MRGGEHDEASAGLPHLVGETLDVEIGDGLGVGLGIALARHGLLGPVHHHAIACLLKPGRVRPQGERLLMERVADRGANQLDRVDLGIETGGTSRRGKTQGDDIRRRNAIVPGKAMRCQRRSSAGRVPVRVFPAAVTRGGAPGCCCGSLTPGPRSRQPCPP